MSAQPTIVQTYSLVDAVQMVADSGLGGVPQPLQKTMLSQLQLWTAMFRVRSLTRAVSQT